MLELYYDVCKIGDEFNSESRTMSEMDIMLFASMTGDNNMIHTDENYAKNTQFETRIAHGLLGLSMGMGLFQRIGVFTGQIVYLGMNYCNFLSPVKLGDSIHTKVTIIEKRATKKPGIGIITFTMSVFNQDEVECNRSEHKMMMQKTD